MTSKSGWRTLAKRSYERHKILWELAFFTAGFAFDFFATRKGIDHELLIGQQVLYLLIIGSILYLEFLSTSRAGRPKLGPYLERFWPYRSLVMHFCLGTLMNLYSIFFFMSASWFSSAGFIVLLGAAIVLNELKGLPVYGIDVRIGLYAICVFCFWSLVIPLAVHHVGLWPFVSAFVATVIVIALFVLSLRRRLGKGALRRRLVIPGLTVSACFLVFYLIGLVPPVPIAAKKLGVYQEVRHVGDTFVLKHERPKSRVWQRDAHTFIARPGDKVNLFVAVFSPANFDDTIFVRWLFHDPSEGWKPSDRIPIHITGGRREGFRGTVSKENYTPGDWRVSIETKDDREIARLYFTIIEAKPDADRTWTTEIY